VIAFPTARHAPAVHAPAVPAGDAGAKPAIDRAAHWIQIALTVAVLMLPALSFAGSPFVTGATALSANVLQILTPLAVIGVIAVGVAAWFNKVSWGWAVAAMIGIVLVFGAQQIVQWIRGMFGV
jgi:type IV secretion system protein VirB2